VRIGVISDTHGRIHPGVAKAFRGVDHILHGGDIGGEHVLAALRRIAPVTAVAGNVDGFACGDAGMFARIELGGLRFLLTHILDRPARVQPDVAQQLDESRADVVIFGHSHLPHDERVGELWFFNPASAGPRRFDYPVSVGIFEKNGEQWRAWHVALDERSREALGIHMNRLSRS
jgi:hypothetical protein